MVWSEEIQSKGDGSRDYLGDSEAVQGLFGVSDTQPVGHLRVTKSLISISPREQMTGPYAVSHLPLGHRLDDFQ